MAHFNPDDMSRFAELTIYSTPYKTVGNHQITVDVLVPTKLLSSPASSPRPVALRYHGGGLIAASSLFPDFFPRWLIELALQNSAIIVSPNYRLLPESTVDELYSDVYDSWNWMQTHLASFVAEKTKGAVEADVGRIITAGESAGGLLSLIISLKHADKIRATTAAYPMVDMAGKWFRESFPKPMFGIESDWPRVIIDQHLEKVKSGEAPAIVSEDPRLERVPFMFSYIRNGLFAEAFPLKKRELFPLFRLEDGERFPKGGVFVIHGEQDSVVPVDGSRLLEAKIKELAPETKFKLAVREGDHGFDGETKVAEEWFSDGIKSIVDAWLA